MLLNFYNKKDTTQRFRKKNHRFIIIEFVKTCDQFVIGHKSGHGHHSHHRSGHGRRLVSKELDHFGAIAAFFRDWAPGILTGGA